jgi:hypothetical protein
MAERYLVATGDVEVAANWNGGTLPTASDDCYANGFTGTFSANRNALSWRTTAGATAVAGGGWVLATGGLVIGGNIIAGSTDCVAASGASGTVTINGNISGSDTSGNIRGILKSSSGTLVVNGNSTGGSANLANGILSTGANGTLVVNGNSTGGTVSTARGIRVESGNSQTVTVDGVITGGAGSINSHGVDIRSGSGHTITITGDPCGGVSSGLLISTNCTLVINGSPKGSITGATTGAGVSLTTALTTPAIINGNAIGGTSTAEGGVPGVSVTGGASCQITGYAIGSPSGGANAGVFCDSASTCTVGEIRVSATGVLGARGKVFLANLTTGTLQAANSALTAKTFYPTDFAGLLPAVGDVRSGTVYNLTNSTGTCAVPTASQTLDQIAVDNTTGNVVLPVVADVKDGVLFGPSSSLVGELVGADPAEIAEAVWEYAERGLTEAVELDSAATTLQLDAIEDAVNANTGYLTTLLDRITSTLFSGITSLGDWIRRISRKDVGSAGMIAAEAEIQTGGTATFVGTTHSLESINNRVGTVLGNVVAFVAERESNGFPTSLRKGDACTVANGAAIYVRIYSPEDTEFTTPLKGSGSLLFDDAEGIEFALTLLDEETPEVQIACEWIETVDDGYFQIEWDEEALDDVTSFITGSRTYHTWGIKVKWPTTTQMLTVAEGRTKVLNPIVGPIV